MPYASLFNRASDSNDEVRLSAWIEKISADFFKPSCGPPAESKKKASKRQSKCHGTAIFGDEGSWISYHNINNDHVNDNVRNTSFLTFFAKHCLFN